MRDLNASISVPREGEGEGEGRRGLRLIKLFSPQIGNIIMV